MFHFYEKKLPSAAHNARARGMHKIETKTTHETGTGLSQLLKGLHSRTPPVPTAEGLHSRTSPVLTQVFVLAFQVFTSVSSFWGFPIKFAGCHQTCFFSWHGPNNFYCIRLISPINLRFPSVSRRADSFIILSVHYVLCIFSQNPHLQCHQMFISLPFHCPHFKCIQ